MPECFRMKTDSPQLVSKLMLRSEALHRALHCFENLLRTTRFDELFFQSVLMIWFKIAKQNFQKSPIKTKTKLVASSFASRVQFWFQNFQLWQKNLVLFKAQMAASELLADFGLRQDGRKCEELRQINCKLGVYGQADGSSYLEQGNTKILAAVYGKTWKMYMEKIMGFDGFDTLLKIAICRTERAST